MMAKSSNSFQRWFKKRNRTIAGCVAILIFCVLMLVVIYYTLDSSGSTMCKLCPRVSFTEYRKAAFGPSNVCQFEGERCNLVCRSLSDDKIAKIIIEATQHEDCPGISLQILYTSFSYGTIRTGWLKDLQIGVKKLEFFESYFATIEPGAFTNGPFTNLETLVISDAEVSHLTRNIFTGMNSLKNFAINFINYDKMKNFKVEPGVFADINLQNLTIHKLLKKHEEVSNFLQGGNFKIIDFSFNSLEEIPGGTFNNLRALESLNLSNNRLKKIHVDAFRGLDIVKLDLSKNYIRTLDEGTFYPKAEFPKEIFVGKNPWNCNCPLYWFKELVLMGNSPVKKDPPPLCSNNIPFENYEWDPGCSPPTTTTQKPTQPTEKPTTAAVPSTTTPSTTTKEPTTPTEISVRPTTIEEPSTSTPATVKPSTTKQPTTPTTIPVKPTTIPQTIVTTTDDPAATTAKKPSTTQATSTTRFTTETDLPVSTDVTTAVSELHSTTEELVWTVNKTTTDLVGTTVPLQCRNGGNKPGYLPFEVETVLVDEISIYLGNQTVHLSFFQVEDFAVMEVLAAGDLRDLNLVYYESSTGVNCVGNLDAKIFLEDIRPETIYAFCLRFGVEETVRVERCFGVKTLEVWERRTWLENGTRAAVISTFLTTLFLSVMGTSVIVFFCIRQNPNLIKGNKRVVIIGNKATEAIVLPKDFQANTPIPPPKDIFNDPSYITPIYEKLKFKPGFRNRSLSDASVSSYINNLPQSRKNTLDCMRQQRAQPDDFFNDGYEVSHLPPPLPPCHPTQENIYEDNIYFAPQC